MALNHSSQWPSYNTSRPAICTQVSHCFCSVARPLQSLSRATHSKQNSASSSTSLSGACLDDQLSACPEDASPICVFLPNGRQFQIQVVVRRGGPPEWSFSGMGGLPPPTATGVIQSSSSSSVVELSGQTSTDAALAESDMLPWDFTEQQEQEQQSAAMQAAAKSLAAIFNPQASTPPRPPAAAAALAMHPELQQPSLRFVDRQQQLLHYQQQEEQTGVHQTSLEQQQQRRQQQQQGLQWWQQQQTREVLLQRIKAAVHPWQVAQIVTSHYDKFTADVTSAALCKLEALAPFKLVEALNIQGPADGLQPVSRKGSSKNNSISNSYDTSHDRQLPKQSRSEERQNAVALYQRIMGLDENWQPLWPNQQQQWHHDGLSSSSSSSIYAWQQQQQRKYNWQGPLYDSIQDHANENPADGLAAAAAAARQSDSSSSSSDHTRRLNQHLKPLVRGYLRCMQLLLSQAPDVTAAALLTASQLAARFVGPPCKVHTWWTRANGYAVLGEAALRFREGGLAVHAAVEISYSYQHCGYSPTVLLQEVLGALKTRPSVLMGLSVREVCHMTYCITCNPNLQYSPKTLTAAVLQLLQNPSTIASARPYDLVMVLRHLCQLNPSPPEGIEQGLVLAVISKMPQMSMQELSTVLHIAVEWRLQCKLLLAELAARLVAAAAGLPAPQQQQQQYMPEWDAPAGQEWQQQHAAAAAAAAAAVAMAMAAAADNPLQEQRRQQQRRLPLTAADPVFLLHRFCQCGYTVPRPTLHFLLNAVGPRLHQISLLQAGLLARALVMQWEDPQGCYEVLSAGLEPWMVLGPTVTPSGTSGYTSDAPVAFPGTASDASAGQGGTSGDTPRLAAVSSTVLDIPYWQLKGLLVAAGRLGPLADDMAAAAAAESDTSSPRWRKISSALHNFQQQQQQQHCQARPDMGVGDGPLGATSSSSSSVRLQQQQQQCKQGTDGGRAVAVAFVSGLLDLLEQLTTSSSSGGGNSSSSSGVGPTSQSSPTQLIEWRADMVLALFWAAARLGLNPGPRVLQDGTAVLAARMHRQISHREIVHMVWAAAALGIKDAAFLGRLCDCLCRYAPKLHPKSIATAAWALAQLRCPHTTALAALSKSLLSSGGMTDDHQRVREKCWGRKQQQQQPPWVPSSGSSSSSSNSSRKLLQGSYYFRNNIKPLPTWHDWDPLNSSSDNSSDSSSGVEQHFPKGVELLARHPRITLLGRSHLAKLACSCMKAGWAPPQLLLVLAVQAVRVMSQMQPPDLMQLMWAYATAQCRIPHLTHAAAAQAAVLAQQRAFSRSKQAVTLLYAFRVLGLSDSEANVGLTSELHRLQQLETQQQQQQQSSK